ncbi:PQQ-binding-like beta-propeller repeat protein [Modestobacter sp. Leaf380]|uniref:outer membrane protein assembly factor BamB family protein n=1 Tax=Modestobacter sp. Leaf380 TaxID=1736356 RepID=UPI0006F40EC9|nr:PQQ-binding-like beta-propeller repeat protein [Modestobacter sp. Leaf380]KQS73373.1 hypothetical protein ASG41_01520 [Modestobacter sp. Leaf380]
MAVRRPPLRALVWTAATLVVVVVLALLWRGSDAAVTDSTTAAEPAPASGSPAAALDRGWSADPTGPAPRRVVESGRVVLALTDGVRVLDPATGEEAWRYTRSNARLCDVTAVEGAVVAVFSTGGRCNEVVALDAGTGVRSWYRTVGFRADVALASTERIVLASSPTGLATIDPTGNNTRWRYEVPGGCRLTGADVGSTGVVALQVCDGGPVTALLFDGFDGSQTWSRDLGVDSARLVGVDRLVDVVVGDSLQVLSPADGATLQTIPLPAAAGADDEPLQQAGLADTALVWVRGTAYVLDQTTGAVRWSVPATGLPAVGDGGKTTDGAVLVPEDGAFVSRDLATGTELARSTAPEDVPRGGRASVVGGTVVVATPGEVVGYR